MSVPIINSGSYNQPSNISASHPEIDLTKYPAIKDGRLELIAGGIAIAAKEIHPKMSGWSHIIAYFTSIKVMVPIGNNEYKAYYLNIRSLSNKLNLHESYVHQISKNYHALDQFNAIAIIRSSPMIRKVKYKSDLQKLVRDVVYLRDNLTFKVGDKEGQRFFMRVADDGRKYLYASKLIGAGAFGKVYQVYNNDEISPHMVVKKARKKVLVKNKVENTESVEITTRRSDQPKSDLNNEQQMLKAINPEGNLTGIQKPPVSKAKNGMYFAHEYAGDLYDVNENYGFQKLKVVDRLKLCMQLLKGLETIHSKGYIHGDIKPGNCLIETDKQNKTVKFVISDFGSVQKSFPIERLNAFTEAYLPKDYIKLVEDVSEELKEILEMNDVFALSKTIIETLLDRTLPNMLYTRNPKSRSKLIKKLKDKGISENIAKILISGMYRYEYRPTAAAMLRSLKEELVKLT